MSNLPKLSPPEVIAERLPLIFPVGTPNRNNCVRDIAAKTVFTMLYVGAIEDWGIFCSPQHVYRMTEEQSHKMEQADRTEYYRCVLDRNCKIEGSRWYQDNTRESIRDETLRDGLVEIGAAVVNQSIPTTSSKPRYALKKDFSDLFDPDISGNELEKLISNWQEKNLSKNALTRLKINLSGANPADKILVTFPNGETRPLDPGPSSIIAKHVIEVFAKKFLQRPFVLWLSESGNKVTVKDDQLASELGLSIDVSKDLPDIILVDVGPEQPLIIFVEVVATDGAITPRRMEAIYQLTDKAGFNRSQILFVTAYMDRQSAGFKKTISELEWNSFVWFASEPGKIFILYNGVISLSVIVDRFKK
jgi:hypothetical protein